MSTLVTAGFQNKSELHKYDESVAGDMVDYTDYVADAPDTSMEGFPKELQSIFADQPFPVDAADIYANKKEKSGPVYILYEDNIREYLFRASSRTILATFQDAYSVSSTSSHPFNAIPQSPSQMPSRITALRTNKDIGKTIAFVGKEMYEHEWGTGTWTFYGLVRCPTEIIAP